jgi:hypothetical protein
MIRRLGRFSRFEEAHAKAPRGKGAKEESKLFLSLRLRSLALLREPLSLLLKSAQSA